MYELNQQKQITLSEAAKERLRRNAESRQNDSKYLKLEPREVKTLKFNPEQIDQMVVDFSGRKTTRYRYTVTEVGSSNQQEKYFSIGKRTSEKIDALLLEGQVLLKIQRFGLGKETDYQVSTV
jgi:hypothetical protein